MRKLISGLVKAFENNKKDILFLSNLTFAKRTIPMKSECILYKFKNGKNA